MMRQCVLLAVFVSCAVAPVLGQRAAETAFVDSVLARMTLEDKAVQVN